MANYLHDRMGAIEEKLDVLLEGVAIIMRMLADEDDEEPKTDLDGSPIPRERDGTETL